MLVKFGILMVPLEFDLGQIFIDVEINDIGFGFYFLILGINQYIWNGSFCSVFLLLSYILYLCCSHNAPISMFLNITSWVEEHFSICGSTKTKFVDFSI